MNSSAPESPAVLAPPGTSTYLPTLLACIRSVHPTLPLDPVVLQSILLCLVTHVPGSSPLTRCDAIGDNERREGIGGQGACANLILRTREEDIGLLVHLVGLMLTTVFGLSTHKHKISPEQLDENIRSRSTPKLRTARAATATDPDVFLRSLFFRRPTALKTTAAARGNRRGSSHSHQRSSSHTPRPSPLRVAQSIERDEERTDENSAEYFDGASLASSRRPLLGTFTPGSTVRSHRLQAERLRSDPLPLISAFIPLEEAPTSSPPKGERNIPDAMTGTDAGAEDSHLLSGTLPKAIVVSGLEHAGAPAQRALLEVLAERRLVLEGDNDAEEGQSGERREGGTWNLPEDFIIIYVCKSDPWERPNVLRGLVDKFAMSADIALSSSTRQAYVAYRTTHASTPHGSPFPTPHGLPPSKPSSPASTPPSTLRSPPFRLSPLLPQSPPAPPLIPPSELSLLRALASPAPSPNVDAYTTIHPSLGRYLRDLFAAARHHPALDGTLLTRRAHGEAEALARAYRVLVGDSMGTEMLGRSDLEDGPEGGESWSGEGEEGSMEWEKAGMRMGLGWSELDHEGDTVAGDVEMRKDLDGGASDRIGDGAGAVRVNINLEGLGNLGATQPVDMCSQVQLQPRAEVWDVSEVDIARVFPRVVSHRLRARDGPDHEILGSVMWPAVDVLPSRSETVHGSEERWERKTVKEVLVGILADV
ncbi:hypothetical protein AcV7_003767 [Taiwanofungus camphoratus]|nr:hypothetical protein AcV7_003767 [Antrodia cinnamomea]